MLSSGFSAPEKAGLLMTYPSTLLFPGTGTFASAGSGGSSFHQRITVSTVAVALNSNPRSGARLVIRNTDATNAVDLGPDTVAPGTGFPLAAGAVVEIDVKPRNVVSAIRSGSADVILGVLRT